MIPRCEESVTLLFGGLSIHFSVTSRLGMPSDAESEQFERNEVFRRLPDVGSFFAEGNHFCRIEKAKLILDAALRGRSTGTARSTSESTGTINELLELKLNREIRPTSAVGPH